MFLCFVALGLLAVPTIVAAFMLGSPRPWVWTLGVLASASILVGSSALVGALVFRGSRLDAAILVGLLLLFLVTVLATRSSVRSARTRAAWAVPLAVLPAVCSAWASWKGSPRSRDVARENVHVRASEIVEATPPPCVAVDFVQRGTERRRAYCPHPHNPFPTETEPSRYRGSLVVAGRELAWGDERKLLPVAALRAGTSLYLLGQMFDCGRWWDTFEWYGVDDARARLEVVSATTVEGSCADLQFVDRARTRYYEFWRMGEVFAR